jgi:carbonic anhydrase
MSIEDMLRKNREWAAGATSNDPDFFTRQLGGQRPKLLWIGCSDSRVPAEQLLGCGPGELFIHRNVANVVAFNDVNISAVVQYATTALNVPDIVVCGHYNCGGVEAACSDQVREGYIADWLMFTGRAQRWVKDRLQKAGEDVSHEDFLRLVVEENVRLQVKHLSQLSVLRNAWERTPGVPKLHGWVYDLGTGLIKTLEIDE